MLLTRGEIKKRKNYKYNKIYDVIKKNIKIKNVDKVFKIKANLYIWLFFINLILNHTENQGATAQPRGSTQTFTSSLVTAFSSL